MATLPASRPDDYAQRLSTIRRHLIGLTAAIDALEREMLALHAPQSDGERAAMRAREEIFLTGPQNIKEALDSEVNRMIAKKNRSL